MPSLGQVGLLPYPTIAGLYSSWVGVISILWLAPRLQAAYLAHVGMIALFR